jgi:hypothetical protein
MKRHDVGVSVKLAAGGLLPAGTPVGFTILAGGSKVKDYMERTDAAGKALFRGIPTNPEVQGSLRYEVWVDYNDVRFPFSFDGVPTTGSVVELVVQDVSPSLDAVSLEHTFIEAFPDEESLVIRHQMRLINSGQSAVDLGRYEGGGLKLPCPEGAKHPSLHDDHSPTLEVRGTDVWFTGALLPGKPAVISIFYSVPYTTTTFEWNQTLPVPSTVNVVVVPKDRQKAHQVAHPLSIETRGAFGSVADSTVEGGKRFQVLRAEGVTLKAGEALRFAVTGLPIPSRTPIYILFASILAVLGLLLFGIKRPDASEGPTLSRGHIEAERDRLVRTLARMRKAHEKGRLSKVRFERESEAISARLVSLYHALDRL